MVKNKIWYLANLFFGKVDYILGCVAAVYFKFGKNKELLRKSNDILSCVDKEELYTCLNDLKDENIDDLVKEIFLLRNDDIRNLTIPMQLSYIVRDLLNIEKSNEIILDTCSGLGKFLYTICESKSNNLYYGVEKNSSNSIIAKMILDLKNVNYKIIDNDFLNCNLDNYTKAFIDPPFGLRYIDSCKEDKFSLHLSSRSSCEWFFIDRVIKSMDKNKRAVALVPIKALFEASSSSYRKFLINKGLIEGIIYLPSGIFDTTLIFTALIIFSEGNKGIKFVDARNYYEPIKKGITKILDNNKIIEKYNETVIRDNRNVLELDNLSLEAVFFKKIELENAIEIDKIGNVFQGTQYTVANFKDKICDEKTGYRLLTSQDIEGGFINWDKLTYISGDNKKLDKYVLQKNDVILTSKSSNVKITVVDDESKVKTILTGGMLCIRPDINKINPYFIKMFFDSKVGVELLKTIQRGTIIKTITLSSLKTLNISCPSLEKQKISMEKYIRLLKMREAIKLQLLNLDESIANFYNNEFEKE